MAVTQRTIKAGKILYRIITGRKNTEKKDRAKRSQPTVEQVEKNNQRYAERDLFLKLNHNFQEHDLHVVFTYDGEEPSKEESYKILKEFKRALLKEYRKRGIVLKWIEVTEYENKRIHHHVVLSKGMSAKELANLWGQGKIMITPMYEEGNYRNLAAYLIKESSKTIRSDNPFSKKRFRCSRSIENPPVFREEVKVSKLLEEPKPVKGYYVDDDSIYKGVNPETERQYIEFCMLPIEDEEQAKRIRGRKEKYKKDSADWWLKKHATKQLEIDIPF
nr:hypothetical protein [uncultured Aminipila sp.]